MLSTTIHDIAARVRAELTAYYAAADAPDGRARREAAIRARMTAEADPALSARALKARLHEVIAELADPVCFATTPFTFECGVRPRRSWGVGGAGTWLTEHLAHRFGDDAPLRPFSDTGLTWWYNPVDLDHFNLGYDAVLAKGVDGLRAEVRAARTDDPAATDFLDAVERSLDAFQALVDRFAEGYAAQAADSAFASRCAEALRRVPAAPPRTLFEALLTLSAWRELGASLEGVGISTLGHLDRLLYPYYAADLAAGRLTDDDAAELLTRYLVYTDCRYVDLRADTWAESSTCMNLGGCDADGTPVCNDLTFLLLRLHRALRLINPKPHVRVSAASDPVLLREAAAHIAGGYNTLDVYNDDVLIPAQAKMGKRLEDCRLYVNGGCQEPMLPGFEHSAGAHWYVNLPRVLEMSLHGADPALPITRIDPAADFDAVYATVLGNLGAVVAAEAVLERARGVHWPDVCPLPLVSATLADCLAQGRDLTQGGARYNPTAVCFVGFATLADSLFAIREAAFTRGLCTLTELRDALAANFAGHDALRLALRRLPHYGQDDPAADAFAGRVARNIAATCRGHVNERGGPLQPALFSYYQFHHMGAHVGATPDGRHAGDNLSQGAAPSHIAAPPSLAHYFAGVGSIDFTEFPAIGVLDLQLPLMSDTAVLVDACTALLQTFLRVGGPMLQPSAVDPDLLRQAQAHPDAHRDLVVRVSGYSTYFVALEKHVQDEIIARTLVRAS